jgi:hypothetical protein
MSTDVSEVRAASYHQGSETPVYIQLGIRQYIPEDSELLTP